MAKIKSRQMPVIAAISTESQLSPEQRLWIRVLHRLYEDVARGGEAVFLRLSEAERAQLAFVACAVGIGGEEVLPTVVRRGQRAYIASTERKISACQ
jgi:hypothetical protein